jgi:hypothetical protein
VFKDKALCVFLVGRCTLKLFFVSLLTLIFTGLSAFGDTFWQSNKGDCNCFSRGNQYYVQPSGFPAKFKFSVVPGKKAGFFEL